MVNISLLPELLCNFDESTIFTIWEKTNSLLPENFQDKIHKNTENDENQNKIAINALSEFLQINFRLYKKIRMIWPIIQQSISSFLIYKSLQKLQNDRSKLEYKKIKDGNFIDLYILNHGCTSNIYLVYHVEMEQLFVKKVYKNALSLEHELNSYENIKYPSFPHFYKFDNHKDHKSIIIEYIRGKTLYNKIKNDELNETEKHNIIFQLMLIIEYLQFHKLVYRDLKPDNIMITQNNQVILLDFDQMINTKKIEPEYTVTADFGSVFTCPELKNSQSYNYTFKEDIYSIGIIIYFIFFKDLPEIGRTDKSNQENYSFDSFSHPYLRRICEECTETDPNERPCITKLIDFFFSYFCFQNSQKTLSFINIKKDKFYPQWLNNELYFESHIHPKLGEVYEYYYQETNKIHFFFQCSDEVDYPDAYYSSSINKIIDSLLKVATPESNYNLGVIYYEGIYVKQDIEKAFDYLNLAAKQNYLIAQNKLGLIYFESQIVPHDVNKAIHYFTLAADQNYAPAQFNLGFIHYLSKNSNLARDMDKAIKYLKLSAKQNFLLAQKALGDIYYVENYVTRDISQSLYYYTLAANQNDLESQVFLGMVYLCGDDVGINIEKAIHFFTLASNQNSPEAQCSLGFIYFNGKYVDRDINKALHYFRLSAKQGNQFARMFCDIINNNILDLKEIDIYKFYEYHFSNFGSDTVAISEFQFCIGITYLESEPSIENYSRAIHYFELSAKLNNPKSLYMMGFFNKDKNMNKAMYYFYLSAEKGFGLAQFALGVIYSKGDFVKRDIAKAIHYYKRASTNDIYYAKNNLSVIFRNGIETEKRIVYAIELLNESIKLDDSAALYNLAHIYFYEKDINVNDYDDIINMLIKCIMNGKLLNVSYNLLGIVLLKKHQSSFISYKTIMDEIESHQSTNRDITFEIINNVYIYIIKIQDPVYYEKEYQKYKKIDFMYDIDFEMYETRFLIPKKKEEVIRGKPINNIFYKGFEFPI